MTIWHDGRLAVLDLETTSANPEEARLVIASVGFVGGQRETDVWALIADSNVEIPAEAAAIHGYDTARVREEGRPAGEVLDIVLGTLDQRPPGAPIVAFNARYDLTVLERECRRHGLDPVDANRPLLVVDPLVLDKHLHRYRKGSRKLAAMCAHYQARHDAEHLAAADAISAGRLAWVIAKRGRVIRRTRDDQENAELTRLHREWLAVRDDLQLLHQAQQRWAAEQAHGLAEHFERKGQSHDVIADWPVIPYQPPASSVAA